MVPDARATAAPQDGTATSAHSEFFRLRNLVLVDGGRPHQASGGSRSGHASILAATVGLPEFLARCSKEYLYQPRLVPRRILTHPDAGVKNDGWDNIEYDYIARVGDRLKTKSGKEFEILDWQGKGSFGQVFRCKEIGEDRLVAIKIVKSKTGYLRQAKSEAAILEHLRSKIDSNVSEDGNRIIRMFGYFLFRRHLCVVFEMMAVNLFDTLKGRGFRGVPASCTYSVTVQMLEGLRFLRDCSIIHCDLKPENVMFVSCTLPVRVKLVDFGSACWAHTPIHTYIQSRFYRSPEVMLGLPYSSAIDMWSLGCVCAELYLGLPIFPGITEFDMVYRIVKMVGAPPAHMLSAGFKTRKYFKRLEATGGADRTAGGEGGGADAPGSAASSVEADEDTDVVPIDVTFAESAGPGGSEVAPSAADGGGAPGRAEQPRIGVSTPAAGAAAPLPPPPPAPSSGHRTEEGAAGPPPAVDEPSGAGAAAAAPSKPRLPAAACQQPASLEPEESQCSTTDAAGPPASAAEEAPARGADDGAEWRGPGGTKRLRPRRRSLKHVWRLKTMEEYERDERKKVQEPKKYFDFDSLEQMVEQYSDGLWDKDRKSSFLQLLGGLLTIDPEERWTPRQAMAHSFANTEVAFDGNFRPPRDEPVPAMLATACGGLICSSASSAASTPSGRSGMGGKGSRRGQLSDVLSVGSRAMSSTATPGSSYCGGTMGGFSMEAAPKQAARGVGGTSPWHLASPASEGTASERIPSSRLSGSDSCWEVLSRGSISQSDTSGSYWPRSAQLSDSDATSAGPGQESDRHDASMRVPADRRWQHLGVRARLDSSGLSPGGGYRGPVGIGKVGPVVCGSWASGAVVAGGGGLAPCAAAVGLSAPGADGEAAASSQAGPPALPGAPALSTLPAAPPHAAPPSAPKVER